MLTSCSYIINIFMYVHASVTILICTEMLRSSHEKALNPYVAWWFEVPENMKPDFISH